MNKKFLFCLLAALPCALTATGCGAAANPSVSPSVATEAAIAQGSFSPEDIKSVSLDGKEYSLPHYYRDFLDKGWTISEELYEELVEQEIDYTLPLENEAYPDVSLQLSAKYWSAQYSDIKSLEAALEEYGVWGIGIQIDPEKADWKDTECPAFEVKGVNLDSSPEDVIAAFGSDYDPNYSDSGLYFYQTSETEGDALRYSCLYFSFEGDKLYEIQLASCY